MNIENLFICPECKNELSETLKCVNCGSEYNLKYGVYNIISQKISQNQNSWNISDEEIERVIPENQSNNAEEPEWVRDYFSRISDETRQGQQKLNDFMFQLYGTLSGTVCDLATGMGGNLDRLLSVKTKNFDIVCTDVDPKILAMTRKNKKTDDSKVFYIATDGRCMSLKDNIFDYITSVAAFGNIPESDKVAKELYRLLKPNGKLIIEGIYIELDSKSYEVAKNLQLEKGLVEDFITMELRNAGFKNIESTVVAKAVWAENPYDRLPVAGDTQYFSVIQATK